MLTGLLPRPAGVAWAGAVVGLGWAAGAADVGCAAGGVAVLGPHAALAEMPATSKPSERRSCRRVGPRRLFGGSSSKCMNPYCAFVFNSAHLLCAQWSGAPTMTTQVPCLHLDTIRDVTPSSE